MDHLPKLIEDLALILIVGAIVTILFKSIKQPLILGYIIAGFLVGPHISLTPTVADAENVQTLAEIGVIFLLFSLGLEFNLKKLMHVGGNASITAVFEIVTILVAGYMLGKMMGWSATDSLFLGGMLASSSTTIIIKAFDDLGVRTKQFSIVVMGVLIIEDIVVIMLLVLLPTLALAQKFEGTVLLLTISKLMFFLVLMFVVGVFLLPTFLKKTKKFFNEETLLIFSVGLCLGMVVLASNAGFSAELGAFMMGFILAEAANSQKIEKVLKPVKDLFAAVFFVSIGMMIDPGVLTENGWAVFGVTLLTIFGKFLSTTVGAIISGQPLKQSVQVGMSMAQIGEFAFIVASLGLSLGVISNFLFPVAVGASAITTFVTPYMIRYSDHFYVFIEKVLPSGWLNFLQNYSSGIYSLQSEKAWRKVLRSYSSIILTNSIVSIAIIFIITDFFMPFTYDLFQESTLTKITGLIVALGAISPFLYGIMAKHQKFLSYRELWMNQKYNRGPLVILEIFRIIIGLLIIGFLLNRIFSASIAFVVIGPVILFVLFIFSTQIRKFYLRLEKRFLNNLNYNHSLSAENTEKVQQQLTAFLDLSPWDLHIIELEVSPYATFIGKPLEQLAWREKYEINIAYIKRGDEMIYSPSANSRLFPFDIAGIISTDEQIKKFLPEFSISETIKSIDEPDDFIIQKIQVNEKNNLKGRSIKESGIKELTNGIIIGIERKNRRIINPVSSTEFEWGDFVWIAGERKKILKLM